MRHFLDIKIVGRIRFDVSINWDKEGSAKMGIIQTQNPVNLGL